MRFETYDEDKGIRTQYSVHLEGVSLDFDSSWTLGSEVRIYTCFKLLGLKCEEELHRVYDCPRSLVWTARSQVWTPSAILLENEGTDVLVQYTRGNDGLTHTGDIARCEDIQALVQNAGYQGGVTHLEIPRELVFGTSTVRLMAYKIYQYDKQEIFKLSVVIENIHRDEWNELLEYQQYMDGEGIDPIAEEVPLAWRGNEQIIEQIPESPWQHDRSGISDDIRQVAHESMALALKYERAQSEAIQRGLSYDDFRWEFPNNEMRVVCSTSTETDTPLRALRLDVYLSIEFSLYRLKAFLDISYIELTITSITRSPSLTKPLSSCTLRLDTPYAALANAAIPNHSAQIIEISPCSQSAERVITTSGPIHVNGPLQIMGSVMGDMFAAPIYGGNIGGRNNFNHSTSSPLIETVASAVLRAMRSETSGERSFVPPTEGGRNRRRSRARHDDEAGVDVEPPRKRRARQSQA